MENSTTPFRAIYVFEGWITVLLRKSHSTALCSHFLQILSKDLKKIEHTLISNVIFYSWASLSPARNRSRNIQQSKLYNLSIKKKKDLQNPRPLNSLKLLSKSAGLFWTLSLSWTSLPYGPFCQSTVLRSSWQSDLVHKVWISIKSAEMWTWTMESWLLSSPKFSCVWALWNQPSHQPHS